LQTAGDASKAELDKLSLQVKALREELKKEKGESKRKCEAEINQSS
jgi:hypothetical protein